MKIDLNWIKKIAFNPVSLSVLVQVFFLNQFSYSDEINTNELLKEWKSIDRSISRISQKETEILNTKLDLDLAIDDVSKSISNLTDNIEKRQNIVIGRIRYLNDDSGSDLLRNFIESSNPGELERNHLYFIKTTQFEIELIHQFNKDLIKLKDERVMRLSRLSKVKKIQKELKKQSEKFYLELKKKSIVLNKIRSKLKLDFKKWNDELQEARLNKNKEKINLYQSLLNRNFLDRKGQLTSPTDGNVKVSFGILKTHINSPALPFHGVLFKTNPGSNVRAIADGTVEWTGEIPGLGSTLILDHGRELRSVYSRVRLANLKIGDMIEEGSTLGTVTKDSSFLGQGLYFEIREGRFASDPLRWILTKSELFNEEVTRWEKVQ